MITQCYSNDLCWRVRRVNAGQRIRNIHNLDYHDRLTRALYGMFTRRPVDDGVELFSVLTWLRIVNSRDFIVEVELEDLRPDTVNFSYLAALQLLKYWSQTLRFPNQIIVQMSFSFQHLTSAT